MYLRKFILLAALIGCGFLNPLNASTLTIVNNSEKTLVVQMKDPKQQALIPGLLNGSRLSKIKGSKVETPVLENESGNENIYIRMEDEDNEYSGIFFAIKLEGFDVVLHSYSASPDLDFKGVPFGGGEDLTIIISTPENKVK